MIKRNEKKSGFTLTELSIAIVFISILLLTIASITLNMVQSYHKGVTMKSINTIGLDLIDEFSSAISESPTFEAKTLCESLGNIGSFGDHDADASTPEKWYGGDHNADACMNDSAHEFIYQQPIGKIKVTKNGTDQGDRELPVSGVFCTGKYSYVWNTGFIVSMDSNTHTMSSNIYSLPAASPVESLDGGFRLRKYDDPNRSFCVNNFPEVGGGVTDPRYPKDNNGVVTYKNVIKNTLTSLQNNKISDELIKTSDIALYSLTVNTPISNEITGRTLYSGSFVLGSITGDIDISEEDYSSCNYENASSFDVEYCATNKFNFAMRAMGGNSGN